MSLQKSKAGRLWLRYNELSSEWNRLRMTANIRERCWDFNRRRFWWRLLGLLGNGFDGCDLIECLKFRKLKSQPISKIGALIDHPSCFFLFTPAFQLSSPFFSVIGLKLLCFIQSPHRLLSTFTPRCLAASLALSSTHCTCPDLSRHIYLPWSIFISSVSPRQARW